MIVDFEREFKKNLCFTRSKEHISVILIISHKLFHKNEIIKLPCRHLIALDGYPTASTLIPVGGYAYDAQNDLYIVNCVDHIVLKNIPFSFKLSVNNVGNWSKIVPFPESIIKNLLNEDERMNLKHFEDIYSKEEFEFRYVQFAIC